MRFRIYGPLEVSDDNRPLDAGAIEQRSLPLLNANEVVSTDRLMTRPPGSMLRAALAPDGTRSRFGWRRTGACV